MRVAFWSNVRGTGCVSTDLACMSIWYALKNPLDMSVVFENHKTLLGLQAMLSGDRDSACDLRRPGGLGELLREYSMYDELSVSDIDRIGEGYIGDRLVYFPVGADVGPEQLSFHLDRYFGRFLSVLEDSADVVWMDLQAMSRSNRSILNAADTVVMCLPQNRAVWENVFGNHANIHRKSFYILGNYEEKSELNVEKFSRDYGISPDRIGVIPHSAYLNDAVSKGAMVSFLMNCYQGELPGTQTLKESLDSISEKLFDRLHGVRRERGHDAIYEDVHKAYVADGGVSLYASYSRGKKAGISQGKCV